MGRELQRVRRSLCTLPRLQRHPGSEVPPPTVWADLRPLPPSCAILREICGCWSNE